MSEVIIMPFSAVTAKRSARERRVVRPNYHKRAGGIVGGYIRALELHLYLFHYLCLE